MRKSPLITLALIATSASTVLASDVAFFDRPTFDRWNYPFNSTPGTRDFASTFGSGFVPGMFDDRDAQFLTTYNTAPQIQAGLGAQNYEILSARLVATIDPRFDGAFQVDTTQDAVGSYREPFQDGFAPDFDAGRPVELYGTGFRNGFDPVSYNDSAPWSFGGPTAEDERNAFAIDFDNDGNERDITNNVRDNFETNPWAVGYVEGLNDGDAVPGGSEVIFDINVSDAAIQAYLAAAVDSGWLSLSISSLHSAVQGGPIEFPAFVTNETLFPGLSGPSLQLDVRIIPAPGGIAAMSFGLAFAARRRR